MNTIAITFLVVVVVALAYGLYRALRTPRPPRKCGICESYRELSPLTGYGFCNSVVAAGDPNQGPCMPANGTYPRVVAAGDGCSYWSLVGSAPRG